MGRGAAEENKARLRQPPPMAPLDRGSTGAAPLAGGLSSLVGPSGISKASSEGPRGTHSPKYLEVGGSGGELLMRFPEAQVCPAFP